MILQDILKLVFSIICCRLFTLPYYLVVWRGLCVLVGFDVRLNTVSSHLESSYSNLASQSSKELSVVVSLENCFLADCCENDYSGVTDYLKILKRIRLPVERI